MIGKNDCFRKLGKSVAVQQYFNENIQSLSFDQYFGFNVSIIPQKVVLQEPLLKIINDKFKIKQSGIIRLDPYRCYDWHQDEVRGVSINMLLSPDVDSILLFGNKSPDFDDQYEILRVNYEADTFYLFNTQVKHSVINFDFPRYLFTVEFEEDKFLLGYEDIKKFLGM